MKNKSSYLLIALSFLFMLATQANAFVMYNNTNVTLSVKDTGHHRGAFKTKIAPTGSAACNPSSHGCNGHMKFKVSIGKKTLCEYNIKIDDKPGTYFIITPTPNKDIPQDGSCYIQQFHD